MKKLVALLVFSLGILLFVSCTDNSLEEIEKNELQEKTKLIDTGNSGEVDDDDHTEG